MIKSVDTRASEPPDWLIQTKLQVPPPRSDVIHRPRLLASLREGLISHHLTLLSAPAGYGKTTLLASALHSPLSTLPVAWLALDKEDNDPAIFLAYLVAALRRLNPTRGATTQTLLADLPNPGAQARRIVGALINDVLKNLPDPFVLALDDLHLITEPSIYAALDYLLERMPPQMGLAVGARHDPPLALARLRARGQLAELRLTDLRFTPDETATFLNKTLRLSLSPADLTAIQSRTEGWAAGLRLLAGSLDRIPTPAGRAAFITHLAHTDRYVFDFLADEVLNRQSEATRTFLLETSILSKLTVPLCNAITGRSDAQTILDDLDRRSLFITLVPSPQFPNLPVYQYHALFAEFLRQRLEREQPERVTELHRRAAQAQTVPDRAIGHYLAAEMWEQAAQTIEQIGKRLLRQGLLDTIAGWIHSLPVTLRETRPRLSYLLGVCAWQKGETADAQALLESALRGFEAAGDEAGVGQTLADLATCALLETDFEHSHTLIRRALACPIPLPSRVQLLMARVWLNIIQENQAQAVADFDAALTLTQESSDLESLRVLIFYLNPLFVILPGGLEKIESLHRRALAQMGDEVSLWRVILEGEMAFVHLWRGRLTQAVRCGEKSLSTNARLGSHHFLEMDVTAIMAVVHTIQGDEIAADHFFEKLFRHVGPVALDETAITGTLYLMGRTRWLQGRLEQARQIYVRMETAVSPRELPFAPVLRLMMRGLLEMSEDRHAEAERSLRQAARMERTTPTTALFGSARLLLARLYVEMNRPQDALAELSPLLNECERAETPGLILKEGAIVIPALRLAVERDVHAAFAARLLNLLRATVGATARVTPTAVALTPREVEVLRLIAAGDSNRAIAEQLVISQHTVKSHVAHILSKLDVTSRTQAAVHARELGITPRNIAASA